MPMHLIRLALAGWEAHQRQRRHQRLLLTSKAYRDAHAAVLRGRRHHKPTKANLKAMRDALHDELKRELSHG